MALIIAGSGPTDRYGNSRIIKGKNDSLKGIATALASAGTASARYDKRGVAASADATASEPDLRFNAYVRDAAAWIKPLKADSRFAAVAVVNYSEGSLIGMIAAKESGADAFVSVSGPSRGAAMVLRQQLAGKLSGTLAKRNEAILTSLEEGQTVANVPPELNSLYRASVQPYLISWFRYVPEVQIAQLAIATLIFQGDTDIQVESKDAEALKRA